jgi:PAS domain S-box-containing protein
MRIARSSRLLRLRFMAAASALGVRMLGGARKPRGLADPERRWRAVFENSAVGVGVMDISGRVLTANPALQKMLGYTEDELRQLSLFDITAEDDRAATRSRVTGLLEGKYREYRLLRRYVRRDGSHVWGNTSMSLILDTDGEPSMLVGLVEDVTDRKRTEEALSEAQSDLARVTRVTTMGELAASIAHEVNQPLAALVANGHACMRWLAQEPPNLDEAQDAARRIVRDANRASDVIVRIRAFLRRTEGSKDPVALEDLVQEPLLLVHDRLRHFGIELRFTLEENLPNVTADRVQIQQVLLNLAMNAIEAMATMQENFRRLDVTARRSGSHTVLIAVRDSGVGLGAENRDRVFEAFYTTKPDGMGLGLAISRSIVENHGGLLWASRNEGPGETFQFTLPVVGSES